MAMTLRMAHLRNEDRPWKRGTVDLGAQPASATPFILPADQVNLD
jgi:hypothetical protein